ncbi:inactive protein RESTRICTED TEV MOVEMENT 2-like [Vicia villosa]|uniref:inactive protein RESTRICTED TEV MOVEMENT 2-like n=1 Tax=Vicia villosa TaxID=3911 RepID=UPI00273C0EF9|nr:inactive protein RESTRICTED TEV MOVEMENT 2-like [Vicia villosa]
MAFNSQRTFRAPTFRSQLSVRRVYETLEPRSEQKETPVAHFLHVYLPGYTKDQMRITLQDASQVLRISGERPIQGNNRWRKFDQTYPVPENSDVGTLEAKFEQGTLILKMLKKPISTPQEVEKIQLDHPSSNKGLDEAKLEKVQETIPPTQDMKSDSPQSQSIEKKTQEAIHDDTLSQIAKQTLTNNEPQKDQQDLEPKPTFKDTSKAQIYEKAQEQFVAKPTFKDTIKTQEDEKAQKGPQEFKPKQTFIERTKTQVDEKGQEEFEKKPTFIERTKTQVDEKAQKDQEEFEKKTTFIERTKTQIDEKARKDQEEFEPKPIEKVVTNKNFEEKIMRKSDHEDAEEERILKKEKLEEKYEKPYESSKTMKDVKENEIEREEHSTPKVTNNEKESSSRVSPNQEEKNGIGKLAAASTQFLTKMTEGKWSGDERHLVENVGAAVLVIAAFGAYISYRFST